MRKSKNVGLNGSAMSPHSLILDEDRATSHPMPLEVSQTPFEADVFVVSFMIVKKKVESQLLELAVELLPLSLLAGVPMAELPVG